MQSQISEAGPGVNPLSTGGNRWKTLTYEQYIQRGQSVKASIDANPITDKIVMQKGQRPTDKTRKNACLFDGYSLEQSESGETYFERQGHDLPFQDYDFPSGTKFTLMKWNTRQRARVDPNSLDEHGQPIVQTCTCTEVNHSYYNADLGVIVTASMFSDHDG